MEILGVPENWIFLIFGRLRRSPDVFLAVFGAQLRKANDCNSVVRSTLLFFFISGGPSGMNLRNYEYSCMGIPSHQLCSKMALDMYSVKNYRVRASSVMSRNSTNC